MAERYLSMQSCHCQGHLFTMKNYALSEIVKTLTIEIDKPADEDSDHVHMDFVQVYRLETAEVKNLDGEYSNEEMLVRDEFLIEDDETRFASEAEAVKHINERLEELFG
jgi:hypothetical protein